VTPAEQGRFYWTPCVPVSDRGEATAPRTRPECSSVLVNPSSQTRFTATASGWRIYCVQPPMTTLFLLLTVPWWLIETCDCDTAIHGPNHSRQSRSGQFIVDTQLHTITDINHIMNKYRHVCCITHN